MRRRIPVLVENNGAFDNIYEILDTNCGTQSSLPVKAHATVTIYICVGNNSVYASFKARQKGNTVWNNFDLVGAGEKRSLN